MLGGICMRQEELEGILRYIEHSIDDDRKIYRQVLKERDYEAEMIEKAISNVIVFIRPDMEFSGEQVKQLLRFIYDVPFQKEE